MKPFSLIKFGGSTSWITLNQDICIPLIATWYKRHAKLVKHDVTLELLLQLGAFTGENCKFCSRETADCDCLQAPGGNGPSLLQDVRARSLPKLVTACASASDWRQCAGTSRGIPAFLSLFHRLPSGRGKNDTGVTHSITDMGLVSSRQPSQPSLCSCLMGVPAQLWQIQSCSN